MSGFLRFMSFFGQSLVAAVILGTFILWPMLLLDHIDDSPEPWMFVWMGLTTLAVIAWATWTKAE